MNPLQEMHAVMVDDQAKAMARDVWDIASDEQKAQIREAARIIVALRFASAGIV